MALNEFIQISTMAQHFKLSLKFEGIPNDKVQDKEKFDKLLAAVIANYPLLVKNNLKNKKAEIQVKNETLFITINKGSEEVIDLDHIVDHVRYCVNSICEDINNCIGLMQQHPGPNFEGSITSMRLTEPDNAVLDIFCDPPIQTYSNLILWPLKDFPLSFQNEEQTQKLVSIIEQEIEMSDDRVTLCTRLLEHPDEAQGNQREREKLNEMFKQCPEDCIKNTIEFYKMYKGTMKVLINVFEASLENPGQDLANVLNVASKIPRIIQRLKIFSTEIFQDWMRGFKTVHSIIHNPQQYQDSLLRNNGLAGLTKTKKENILKMMKLNIIQEGDGVYLVRSRKGVGQYAHVAVVTDTNLMNLVHASQNTKLLEREYGKIVEEHFEKVVKKDDECFVVRHQQGELTGKDIAYRARTFANGLPVIKFTYDVVDANCEVVLNAAAGIFVKDCCSIQGQLVKNPYSGLGKKIAGVVLEQLQKSPKESDLLDELYYKLRKYGMLSTREARPSRQQSPLSSNESGNQAEHVSGIPVETNQNIVQEEQILNKKDEIECRESSVSACLEDDMDIGEAMGRTELEDITLEDQGLSEKGEPNKKSSVMLTKKEGSSVAENQIIQFNIRFEAIPNNSANINIFDKLPNQEKENKDKEYQMKLEAHHNFKDSRATSKKAKFILVVDKSGSMQGEPWHQVQSALIRILELTRNSEVSCTVLSYNHDVNVVNLSGIKEVDRANIDKIRATGGTDFAAVFEELGKMFRAVTDTCAYHVFFMTDGHDTRNEASDITKAKELLQIDIEKANTDVMFHVLGFSSDHDAKFLDGLKLIGTQDGTYTYVSPSEESESLGKTIFQLIESTSSILGKTIHIELACDEIEFLGDGFGRSSNEALWPARLTEDKDATRITTTAFVRIKSIKNLQDFDISLNVHENMRGDTKPIEGIIQNRKNTLLSKKEEIDQHILRKSRLAMNLITEKISNPSDTELHDTKIWFEQIKYVYRIFTNQEKVNPTTKRLLENIKTGIDLCDPYFKRTIINVAEMEMKKLAIKNIFEMNTGSEQNRRVCSSKTVAQTGISMYENLRESKLVSDSDSDDSDDIWETMESSITSFSRKSDDD